MKKYFATIVFFMTPFIISYAFWYVIGAGDVGTLDHQKRHDKRQGTFHY